MSLVGNSRYYIKKISSSSQKPECSGTITGYVYDDATNDPIDDALVEWGRIYDDTNGRGKFTLDGDFCPDTRYTIECSADGYESDTKRVTTDDDGNGDVDFYLDPDCDGTISGYVRDTTTRAPIKGALVEVESSGTLHIYSVNRNSDETSRSGRFSIDSNFCPNTRYTIKCSAAGYKLATRSITTERDGDKEVDIYLEPERPVCSGTVSGHVYDASTRRPISGASLLFCHGGDCWAVPVTDSWGLYASIGRHCPSNIYEVTCSADGYRLETKRATTDSLGNAAIDFHLVPLCRGTISGRVYDSSTGRPIPGAALLFCQGGDCWCPPVTDSQGNYESSDRFCPSSTCEITCSADGYKTVTKTITTDSNGNAAFNFILEPLCAGAVSGRVYDAVTGMPISGAALLFCQGGDCWCPQPSDAGGSYSAGGGICPSTACEITCSADGYKPGTKTITTDKDGNFRDLSILLEPENVEIEVSVEATGGVTEVDVGEAPVILVQAKPKGGSAGDLEGASVTLSADGGRFPDTGTAQITGELTKAGAFGRKWDATAPGTYTFTATVSKAGYEVGVATANITIRPDYRLVLEPDTVPQGVETELRVTANLPALEESGEEAVKIGDHIHWFITTPRGQEIEGEKDTFHESRAGGPSDAATYNFPEAGEYVVRVELPESGLEREWKVYAYPQPEIDVSVEATGGATEIEAGDTPVILVEAKLESGSTDQLEGASVTLRATGGEFVESGSSEIFGELNSQGVFGPKWRNMKPGLYRFTAEVSKPGYKSDIASCTLAVKVPSDALLLQNNPDPIVQGKKTELKLIVNLGKVDMKNEDEVDWYITTPSGQLIEGEKDSIKCCYAGGLYDTAYYEFPEAGDYNIRVEFPDYGVDRSWSLHAQPAQMNVTVSATGGATEVAIGETPVILVQAKPEDGTSDQLEGASVALSADGGRFTDTGTAQITGELTKAGSFGRKWEATTSGTYTFTATVSKPAYETGTGSFTLTAKATKIEVLVGATGGITEIEVGDTPVIIVEAKLEDGSIDQLEDASVTLRANGGQFTDTGISQISGKLTRAGSFGRKWKATAPGTYTFNATVSKPGCETGTGSFTLTVKARKIEVSVAATGGITEVETGDTPVILVEAELEDGSVDQLEGASVALRATGGEFVESGASEISGELNSQGVFGPKWRGMIPATYRFTATVSKSGYTSGSSSCTLTVNVPEDALVLNYSPDPIVQGSRTELKLIVDLGKVGMKSGDRVNWYVTMPSGKFIEGEKDSIKCCYAGDLYDTADYDFPESGYYSIKVELPDYDIEKAWTLHAEPAKIDVTVEIPGGVTEVEIGDAPVILVQAEPNDGRSPNLLEGAVVNIVASGGTFMDTSLSQVNGELTRAGAFGPKWVSLVPGEYEFTATVSKPGFGSGTGRFTVRVIDPEKIQDGEDEGESGDEGKGRKGDQEDEKEESCGGVLSGHVYDKDTKNPIGDVLIYRARFDSENGVWVDKSWIGQVVSDENGYFEFERDSCPHTTYMVMCSKEGYVSYRNFVDMDSKGCAEADLYLRRGNDEPRFISVNPDKTSPQKYGSEITWSVVAEDLENDPLEYRFSLYGPSTNYNYMIVRDWSKDNTWTWQTDRGDVGDNFIQTDIRDNKDSERFNLTKSETGTDYGYSDCYCIELFSTEDREFFSSLLELRARECKYHAEFIELKYKQSTGEFVSDDEYKELYNKYNLNLGDSTLEYFERRLADINIDLDVKFVRDGVKRLADFSYNAFTSWRDYHALSELVNGRGVTKKEESVVNILYHLATIYDEQAETWRCGDLDSIDYCDALLQIDYLKTELNEINPNEILKSELEDMCENHKKAIESEYIAVHGDNTRYIEQLMYCRIN